MTKENKGRKPKAWTVFELDGYVIKRDQYNFILFLNDDAEPVGYYPNLEQCLKRMRDDRLLIKLKANRVKTIDKVMKIIEKNNRYFEDKLSGN